MSAKQASAASAKATIMGLKGEHGWKEVMGNEQQRSFLREVANANVDMPPAGPRGWAGCARSRMTRVCSCERAKPARGRFRAEGLPCCNAFPVWRHDYGKPVSETYVLLRCCGCGCDRYDCVSRVLGIISCLSGRARRTGPLSNPHAPWRAVRTNTLSSAGRDWHWGLRNYTEAGSTRFSPKISFASLFGRNKVELEVCDGAAPPRLPEHRST